MRQLRNHPLLKLKIVLKNQAGATLRKAAGLSQEDLGLESNLDRTYVSMLERGVCYPTLTTVFALADALGMRASEIVRRLEEG